MPKVVKRENEDLESLLRRFRRQVNDANILGECRKREYFISNGEKKKQRKIRKQIAIRKQQAEARREARYEFMGIKSRNPEYSTYVAVKGRKQNWNNSSTKPVEQPNVVNTVNKTEVVDKPAFYSYRKSASNKKEGN